MGEGLELRKEWPVVLLYSQGGGGVGTHGGEVC